MVAPNSEQGEQCNAPSSKSEWHRELQQAPPPLVPSPKSLKCCILQDDEEDQQSLTWNIGLGKALLALTQNDSATFTDQLELLIAQQMGPLSAASMEAGSYVRGYDNIIR